MCLLMFIETKNISLPFAFDENPRTDPYGLIIDQFGVPVDDENQYVYWLFQVLTLAFYFLISIREFINL